MNSPIDFFIFK